MKYNQIKSKFKKNVQMLLFFSNVNFDLKQYNKIFLDFLIYQFDHSSRQISQLHLLFLFNRNKSNK